MCFVFTAEAQQIAYEVEKKYIWWRPTYCDACAEHLLDLRTRNQSCQAQWDADRQVLRENKAFLSEWLSVLRDMSALGNGNPSMETHLAKLLYA